MTSTTTPTREDLITIDPEILGGSPVFKGTRVPLDILFDHLETGSTIDEFLDDFPGVSRAQAIAVIEYLKSRAVA
jgi:uncharacterized protein (DUF433 family)